MNAAIINLPELYEDFKTNRDKALPIALYYDHHAPAVQAHITKRVNEYYFDNEELSPRTHQNLTNVFVFLSLFNDVSSKQIILINSQLFTDNWFLSGVDEYLRIRLLKSPQKKAGPTYTYLFSHKAEASFTEIFQGGRENYYGKMTHPHSRTCRLSVKLYYFRRYESC